MAFSNNLFKVSTRQVVHSHQNAVRAPWSGRGIRADFGQKSQIWFGWRARSYGSPANADQLEPLKHKTRADTR